MKLGILALILLIGFPLGLYLLVGKEAFNDANIVLGMMGVGAALLIMGCLFTVKNILSFFFDFLLITFGACLLLVAAFAKPLGLFDGAEGQGIEQRLLQQKLSQQPAQPAVLDEDQDIDHVLNHLEQEPAQPSTATVAETVGDAAAGSRAQTPKLPAIKQAAMPSAVNHGATQEPEGLEAFAEEADTRIIEHVTDAPDNVGGSEGEREAEATNVVDEDEDVTEE